MFWSRGLKAEVGIEELSDADLVDDQEEKSTILWGLTRGHWDALRKHGYVTDYLRDVAQTQSLPAVQAFSTRCSRVLACRGCCPRRIPDAFGRPSGRHGRPQRLGIGGG